MWKLINRDSHYRANTGRRTNVGIMLGQRRRRWPNIIPTLVRRPVLAIIEHWWFPFGLLPPRSRLPGRGINRAPRNFPGLVSLVIFHSCAVTRSILPAAPFTSYQLDTPVNARGGAKSWLLMLLMCDVGSILIHHQYAEPGVGSGTPTTASVSRKNIIQGDGCQQCHV